MSIQEAASAAVSGDRRLAAAEVWRLRESGLSFREIGLRLGMSRSWASELVNDFAGEKKAARRQQYAGSCEVCGKPTDGSNGKAKAPKFCLEHSPAFDLAPCGTRSAYQRGCRCDECRRSMRVYMRSLKGQPAPSHGESGYTNYSCRCAVCRAANAARSRRYYHAQKAKAA